jgi:hypothetical protein
VAVKRVEEEEKGGCSTVGAGGGRGAPFIATRGGWQWRRELQPGAAAAV